MPKVLRESRVTLSKEEVMALVEAHVRETYGCPRNSKVLWFNNGVHVEWKSPIEAVPQESPA